MSTIDETSEALGYIRATVKAIDEKLDHMHACLHDDGGLAPRVNALEAGQAKQQGIAAGLGFLGGSAAVAVIRLAFAKMTGGG